MSDVKVFESILNQGVAMACILSQRRPIQGPTRGKRARALAEETGQGGCNIPASLLDPARSVFIYWPWKSLNCNATRIR